MVLAGSLREMDRGIKKVSLKDEHQPLLSDMNIKICFSETINELVRDVTKCGGSAS